MQIIKPAYAKAHATAHAEIYTAKGRIIWADSSLQASGIVRCWKETWCSRAVTPKRVSIAANVSTNRCAVTTAAGAETACTPSAAPHASQKHLLNAPQERSSARFKPDTVLGLKLCPKKACRRSRFRTCWHA